MGEPSLGGFGGVVFEGEARAGKSWRRGGANGVMRGNTRSGDPLLLHCVRRQLRAIVFPDRECCNLCLFAFEVLRCEGRMKNVEGSGRRGRRPGHARAHVLPARI